MSVGAAQAGIDELMKSFSRAVTMLRLEGIKEEYCTLQAVDNFMLSVNTMALHHETKEDDWAVAQQYTEEHECEPVAPRADLHMPDRHLVNQRVIIQQTPNLDDDAQSVASSKRKAKITKNSLAKLALARKKGSNIAVDMAPSSKGGSDTRKSES